MRTKGIASILWLDCSGGLLVGAGLWLLSGWLQPLYGLPEGLYFGMATANVAYGCFALFVATRRPPTVGLITVLAGANALWSVFCVLAFVQVFRSASLLGYAHLWLEGAYVLWLATMEWRHRVLLSQGNTPADGRGS